MSGSMGALRSEDPITAYGGLWVEGLGFRFRVYSSAVGVCWPQGGAPLTIGKGLIT